MVFAPDQDSGPMATPIKLVKARNTSWDILTCQMQAHPLCCSAALAVQEVIKSENLLENIRTQGAYLGAEIAPNTVQFT
jgi:4-aminobutyrate aminotransferase-like enzyme